MKEIPLDRKEIDLIIASIRFYVGASDKTGNKLIKRLSRAETRIKVSSAKAKGRNLQYWVCTKISELLHIKYNQSDDSCSIHSREMGLNGVDIILRDDAAKKFPYSVECKCQENLNIPAWWKQCKVNCEDDKIPMLIIKKKSIGEPLVIMSWDGFVDTYEKNQGGNA